MAHLNVLNRVTTYPFEFEPIKLNHFTVAIDAGSHTFCEPCSFFNHITDYESVRIQLFELIKDEQTIVSPYKDDRFRLFEWSKYFMHADRKGNIKHSYMGKRVPIEDVCQIIRDTYKVSRLKLFY